MRILGCLVLFVVVAGCGGGDSPSGSLATPRDSVRYQMALLKAGDVENFRACFTQRQRERITPEAVATGAKEMASYSFEDLYATDQMAEYKGRKTCKVRMKNGRTLTTLVETDGAWLADTLWFR